MGDLHIDITFGLPVGWLEDDPRVNKSHCEYKPRQCPKCLDTIGPWHNMGDGLLFCHMCYRKFIDG